MPWQYSLPLALAYHKIQDVQLALPTNPSYQPANGYRRSHSFGQCNLPVDLVLLQDATSFLSDEILEIGETQIRGLLDSMEKQHPNSEVALISFRDKPIFSLGDRTDYCWRFESDFTPDASHLSTAYKRITSAGGADHEENQFGAILAGLGLPAFRESSLKVLVLITDSEAHHADDGDNFYGMIPCTGLTRGCKIQGNCDGENSSQDIPAATTDDRCLLEYYPSLVQISDALRDTGAYLTALVVGNGSASVTEHWQYVLKQSGLPEHLVQRSSASNLSQFISDFLNTIEALECLHQSTTPTAEASVTTRVATTRMATTTISIDRATMSLAEIASTLPRSSTQDAGLESSSPRQSLASLLTSTRPTLGSGVTSQDTRGESELESAAPCRKGGCDRAIYLRVNDVAELKLSLRGSRSGFGEAETGQESAAE